MRQSCKQRCRKTVDCKERKVQSHRRSVEVAEDIVQGVKVESMTLKRVEGRSIVEPKTMEMESATKETTQS